MQEKFAYLVLVKRGNRDWDLPRSVCLHPVSCSKEGQLEETGVARNRTSFYSTRLVAPNIKGSSRRRCKKKMAAVWTVNKIEQFIDLYEQRPCLYNTKMKEYHDRDIRKKAMEEISGVLEVSGEYPMNAPLTSLQTLRQSSSHVVYWRRVWAIRTGAWPGNLHVVTTKLTACLQGSA